MTTEGKLVNRKLSLMELAEYLSNVSEACGTAKGRLHTKFGLLSESFIW